MTKLPKLEAIVQFKTTKNTARLIEIGWTKASVRAWAKQLAEKLCWYSAAQDATLCKQCAMSVSTCSCYTGQVRSELERVANEKEE